MGHWFALNPSAMAELSIDQWVAMFEFLDANTKQ